MKFEVGDTVLLLHSMEEGVVVEIVNEEMVVVNVEGVTFPAYADQLDFPYFNRFSQAKLLPEKKKIRPGEELPREKSRPVRQEETGVWLSFLPVYRMEDYEDIVHTLKIHLINETAAAYHFHYYLYVSQRLMIEIRNTLPPFSHFYLNDLLFESLNDNPRFDLQFSLQEPAPELAETFGKSIKLRPKQVFEKLADVQRREDATFRFLLFEKYPRRPVVEKVNWDIGGLKASQAVPVSVSTDHAVYGGAKYELDLHIEKLIDDFRGLDNFEILTIQLHEFRKYLDLAIAHHQFSMVAIHGIGKGKLRDEIHEILRHVPEVKSFVNQYDVRYGYGATEIFFEYK